MTSIFQNRCRFFTASLVALGVSGCTTPVPRAPTLPVRPALETQAVATTNADAADDPAIWAAPEGLTALFQGEKIEGFVAGTDKKAGLYIYALDGRQIQFIADGLLNNVDLRTVTIDGRDQVLLAASDRGRMGIALYRFDPGSDDTANAVKPWGFIKSDVVEPYGFCMGVIGGIPHAFLVAKDGNVRQYRIDIADGSPSGVEVRRFAIGSQSEGCVVDDAAGTLYVGEELKGLWRYGASANAGDARALIQGVDATGRLVADVEGVALIRDAGKTFILVSSQGDSAFAVWRVDGAEPVYSGRFEVISHNGVDGVSGTDGLDARSGRVGPFPEGLVAIQDDQNEGMSQNFKLVDWREIRQALGL